MSLIGRIMGLAATAVAVALLSGCVTVHSPGDAGSDGPDPTARAVVDGVEQWDLTGEPSTDAFGIPEDRMAGIYETDEPRPILLELPEGTSVQLEARLVTFERTAGSDGDRFSLGIRGATVAPEELHRQLRSLADQLDLPPAEVDIFIAEVTNAPAEQTERVRYSSPSVTYGDLELGVAANVAPIADSGRFTLGGAWE